MSLFNSRTYRDSVAATARLMEPVVPSLSGSSMRRVFGGSGSGSIASGRASFSMTTISHSLGGKRLFLNEVDAACGEVGAMQRGNGDGDGLHAALLAIVHSARPG